MYYKCQMYTKMKPSCQKEIWTARTVGGDKSYKEALSSSGYREQLGQYEAC